jgi:hypothetical protein
MSLTPQKPPAPFWDIAARVVLAALAFGVAAWGLYLL